MERLYPSDMTERQWRILTKLIPKRKRTGRPPLDRRLVLNAILYVDRTGCQWRQLPVNFPNGKSVYTVFWRWRNDRLWQRIHDALREQTRRSADKRKSPSAAIIDSQSVRTAEGGEQHGYDAAKKNTGRKRHIAVDTVGLLLMVVVTGAGMQDENGAAFVLSRMHGLFSRLRVVFGDSAYGRQGLPEWVRETFGWILQTVLRPVHAKGIVVLPKHWIVERTFAWIARYRRHSKDDETTTESSEAMMYIAMINLMSRRLANQ